MYTSLGPFIIWFIILAVCAFAFVKGGRAERLGALTVLSGSIYAYLVHFLAAKSMQPALLLMGEGAIGVAFLLMAMRYPAAWLGGAVLLQAVQCSLHAYYFVGERKHDLTYAIVNNIDTLGILICLTFGAAMAWRRSAKSAK